MAAAGRPSLDMVRSLAEQVFPALPGLRLEPVTEGVSTYVYRVRQGHTVYYLRILPELDAGFAPEVFVHRHLREQGIRVPDVVYFEHYNPRLRRSVMVTTEIKGEPIGHGGDPVALREVMVAAGRDLATINRTPVDGFGWIRRDEPETAMLRAEFTTYRELIHQRVDPSIALLASTGVLDRLELDAIQKIIDHYDHCFDITQAYLAHGDFDGTHIYHVGGSYTGIIDFGEIRGTDPRYDLGHFNIEQAPLLPDLLAGYTEVVALPADAWQRIQLASLLIALARLARRVQRRPQGVADSPDLAAIKRSVATLLS
jgi:aminoglycoside phosphotransferase (APT) family kinase protein